ncbi:MAG: hypothetical protein GX589_09880, partial [Deltaproteobacteria bacterium]|nr:hypothetical protein [Deltaproteobacteria bacterium]
HLINNCKGLLVGNIFLSDPRGVKIGLDLLETQLKEQILLDGGHFERSPMYHLIVMEDLIAISFALLERDGVLPGFLSGVLEKMGGFLEGIISPCGIPLLNDTSCEVADSPQRVLEALPLVLPGYQSPRFVSGGVFYTESGLFIYQSPRLWFFFDVGPIGPDYQLGHAHNDMLSICLAFDGEPILTDSGVYEYRAGAWRDYFRSTAAHNTITVDGIDQNETWKSFRVGRRGYPSEVNYEPPARISAAHTGYKHIGVIHRREVELLENEQAVCVTDLIENRGAPREFESNLHFDPSIRLCTEAALTEESSEQVRSFEFETPKGSRFEVKVEGVGVRLSCGHSWYAPEFGLKQERLNLKIKGRALPGSTRCGFRIGRVRPLLSTT